MPPPEPDTPLRWRARPLLLAAGCLAVGITAASALPGVGFGGWAGLVGTAVVLAAVVALRTRLRLVSLRRLVLMGCAAAALVGLGGARLVLWQTLPPDHISHLAVEADALPFTMPLTVEGRVVGPVTRTERRLRFTLATDSAGLAPLLPVSGRTEVSLWAPRDAEIAPVWPDLRPGHRVAVTGLLRPPPERRNPAEMDYGAYLRRQGLHATVSAPDSAIVVLAFAPSPWERAVGQARAHVRESLRAHVRQQDARGVLEALLLADRSGVTPETREAFAVTGLAHLLAVSGLHVFLVGMVLYGLLKPFLHRFGLSWRRVEVGRAVGAVVLLAAYVAVVGAPASAVRALVMAALFIAGRAVQRPSNALNTLGAAALVLLLVRPTALFDVGFQLSFAAVGGLILLTPVFERRLPRRWFARTAPRWALGLVLASLAATLATMPVLLVHFGRAPWAGVLLNVAGIPLTGAALGGGLLVLLTASWAAPVAELAGAAAEVSARLLLAVGGEGARLFGWTALSASLSDPWLIAAFGSGLAALALWERPRHRWRAVVVTLAFASVALGTSLHRGEAAPALDVLFFDVGQGDAALLRLPNGRHVLVDAGPRDPYADAGLRTVLPHLDHAGIHRLDAVVVTHPHADHFGGALALLEADAVHRVIHSDFPEFAELYREKLAWAAVRGIPVEAVRAGDTLALGGDVRLHVLHPGPEPDLHANDASVVLRVTFGETSFLFTGDVESAAEATLAGRYGPLLCSDVVKVPHHGSRTSSTPAFVEAAAGCGRTRYAVVSVARRNRYGLPNPEPLAAWRAAGADVLLTAEEGAVWLRSDGREVRRVRWR